MNFGKEGTHVNEEERRHQDLEIGRLFHNGLAANRMHATNTALR